jgi:diguanylate cyclase (GGDEF)-like protein
MPFFDFTTESGLRRIAGLTALLWTLLVAASLGWNLYRSRQETLALAYAEAKAVRDKDMAFRRWGMKHGGVYVPVTESEPPAPSLAHLPERDLVCNGERRLTLRAPAQMVREMMDDYATQGGVRGRIVGKKAFNPNNLPDAWEARQLDAFERRERDEVWEIADLDGKPHLRYLKAWFANEVCIHCHGIFGYKVGDLRGATGVNLPLAPYDDLWRQTAWGLSLSHGGFWLLGLLGIGWAARQGLAGARAQARAFAQIEHLAHNDALTGLGNRFGLMNRLEQALAHARRAGGRLAVLLLDMDRFKDVNDSLGHALGDELLVEVARRLKGAVRESDIVARLGGDEFVIVLTNIETARDALAVGEKLLAQLGLPYHVGAQEVHSTPSIGISLFPDNAASAEELLKDADAAMYRAKAAGRNQLAFFSADLAAAAHRRLELERELRAALAADGLRVFYQPQVEAGSGRIRAFEALARWPHPTRGWIPPGEFIPLAEERGLISDLFGRMLERVCAQLIVWRNAGHPALRIALNLSMQQLKAPDCVERIGQALAHHGIPPGALEIEITESAAMADPETTIVRLKALRALGVSIAIDDFGTGYSSLAYLKRLPLDALKIDRTFVAEIETDANDAAICRATIALAKSLNLTVIAEGVETIAQKEFLAALGCDLLQGYLFDRPAPAEVFDARLGVAH